MKKLILSLSMLCSVALLWTACDKKDEDNSGKARVQVRLTDDPGDFDAVYVDVREVRVNMTDADDDGWQTLSGIRPGIYNLLDLVNDKDTLLADAFLPSGRIHQMRLVLGSQNSVVVNGVETPLQTPSAQQSGLKLNIQQDIDGGLLYVILLDFDVAKSIVHTGNGKFILKPVIRTIFESVGGSVKGVVLPDSVKAAVLLMNGNDTIASSFTGANGGYLMKGLPSGNYWLNVRPLHPDFDTAVVNNIVVNAGSVTWVDTVRLRK